MRVVIQKVKHASVTVNDEITGKIDKGLLIFAGFENEDTKEDLEWMAGKITNMRIFNDENDKMNLSLKDVSGGILIVSQFTLHASTKKGNRPSFIYSADPAVAEKLYTDFIEITEKTSGIKPETGIFGAMMQVDLCNDGPVTINIDSKNKE